MPLKLDSIAQISPEKGARHAAQGHVKKKQIFVKKQEEQGESRDRSLY